ncbi:hypothetical protein EDB80DRAFT_683946 [Ilyonectria destructans]|nr:hypothetical protein EDB80DRAFT_683946 [Ilyonectria destructans]
MLILSDVRVHGCGAQALVYTFAVDTRRMALSRPTVSTPSCIIPVTKDGRSRGVEVNVAFLIATGGDVTLTPKSQASEALSEPGGLSGIKGAFFKYGKNWDVKVNFMCGLVATGLGVNTGDDFAEGKRARESDFPVGKDVQLKQISLKINPRNASVRPGVPDSYELGYAVAPVGVEPTVQINFISELFAQTYPFVSGNGTIHLVLPVLFRSLRRIFQGS